MSNPAITLTAKQLAANPESCAEERDALLQEAISLYERPLVAYAHSFVGEWDRAQDVAQDTFLKLHRELRRHEPENLKAWLFTVCRNRSLDVLRKEKRLSPIDHEIIESFGDAEPDPAHMAERHDDHERAMELMQSLPLNQREVIRLKFQADLSYKEISEITGLSVGNVGYLLHHGLKRLRQLMRVKKA